MNGLQLNAAVKNYQTTEYMKQLNLNQLNNPALAKALLANGRYEEDAPAWSIYNRLTVNNQLLRYVYVTNKSTMCTTIFKAHCKTSHSIYAFLHCRVIRKKSGFEFIPEYVSTGPTFTSQDGEFRGRVIQVQQVYNIIKEAPEVFDLVDEMVCYKLQHKIMSFTSATYYPDFCTGNYELLEKYIDENRLAIKLFMLCWMYDYRYIFKQVEENHIHKEYKKIIFQRMDAGVYENICKILDEFKYAALQANIGGHVSAQSYIDPTQVGFLGWSECGQKVFPITAIEAIKTEDINYNVWRELYMTNMSANLVVNLVSPSFPLPISWFYIQNTDQDLFDNEAMHLKFLHSDVAQEVTTELIAADEHNYVKKNKDFGPVSSKFYKLSKLIHKGLVYADSDIKLADASICLFMEYVGRTLRDIPKLLIFKDFMYGLDKSFGDFGIFSKLYFEYIYALYCCNSKLMTMHGDLHMNNATVQRLYNMDPSVYKLPVDVKRVPANPHVCYLVHDEAYVFPHLGFYAAIIDFSRGIIGDYGRLEHEFSPMFAETYFKDQRIRILHMVYMHLPDYYETYSNAIDELVNKNFPLAFRILTLIDSYTITSNLLMLIQTEEFTKIEIAPGIMDLLRKGQAKIKELLKTYMESVIKGTITSASDIDWPNYTLIKHIFSDRIYSAERIAKEDADGTIRIVDIFNENAPMKADVEDYDSWGPLLSAEFENNLRKKNPSAGRDEIYERWEDITSLDETAYIRDIHKKYKTMEEEVIEFEPWMNLV